MASSPAAPLVGAQGPALALAGGCAVGAVLLTPALPWWAAAALCGAAAGIAALRRSWWCVAPLIPLVALSTPTLVGVLAWTLVGMFVPLAWDLRRRVDDRDLRRLRGDVTLATHDAEMLQRHLQRYPQLMQACQALSGSRDLDRLAATMATAVAGIAPDCLSIRVYLGSGSEQELLAQRTIDDHEEIEDLSDDIGYVARELRTLIRRGPINVLACLPLRSDRRAAELARAGAHHRGVLLVRFRSRGAEDVLTLEILDALARLGGLGLAAVDLVAEAKGLALHDDLTGLFGRHEYFRRLQETLAMAARSGGRVGVIMCDMDHLKKLNDTYGHAVGDDALRSVAKAIKDHIPAEAIACRYGGEEFGILVPEAYSDGTEGIAEAIREGITRHTAHAENPEQHLTASLGWALSGENETAAALMERADAACYQAKEQGRNRVVAAP